MEEEVALRIRKIIRQAKLRGVTNEEITKCFKANGYPPTFTSKPTDKKRDEGCSILNCLVFKACPIIFGLLLSLLFIAYLIHRMIAGHACLLTEVSPFGEAVTPIVDCEICKGVTGAPRLSNLSMDDFIRNYAYTSRPILVEGAVSNWSALRVFSYDYFKSLYLKFPKSLEDDNSKGQFFPYSSNIEDLKNLFSLPSEVATMETEKWYIGW